MPSHQLAWDCATGNGQCALGLSPYVKKIIATDASDRQITQASQANKVEYRTMYAECTNIDDHSLDLITVAQVLHWFDIPSFFKEVKRVLKNQGIVSVWTYLLFRIDDDINQIIDHLYQEVLGEFWPVERQWVENAYQGIDFPFEELPSEDLSMTANWSLDRLSGYLTTWSVVREYQDQKGHNPLNLIRDRLARAWGDSNLKRVLHWPLAVRTGRLSF